MTEQTREQQLLEEFKTGLEKEGPIVLAQRVVELEGELSRISEAQGTQQSDKVNNLMQQLDAANARADKAERAATAAKASLTKATPPAKPRKLGTVAVLSDDRKEATAKLQALIDDADEAQIAFSDGTREIAGIAPIDVDGPAWNSDHPNGLLLKLPIDIEGPRDSASSVTIDGYALILDGKQVAYSRRSTPLQVAPGQRVKIENDIIF